MASKEINKKNIMLLLIENDKPITISEISSKLFVSNKTVRNYLEDIEDEFSKLGVNLIKKPNVGTYIDVDKDQRVLLKNTLKLTPSNIYSSENRQNYILNTLLKNRYTYTIQLLADDLYCSKNTILSDLTYVEEWLKKHNLYLKRKQNQGLWVEGTEQSFRNAMMSLFSKMNAENLDKNLDTSLSSELDYRIDFINYKKIKNFFPRINFHIIQEIIQESEKKLGYYFTDQAFVNLIVHIAIAIERIKCNKEIYLEKDSSENIKKNKEYEIAQWVVERLSSEFNLDIPEIESSYICLHMLGAKIQRTNYLEDYNITVYSHEETYEVAKEIVNLVSEILRIDLLNDELLLAGLTLHLRTTIIRLKNNLQLRNPLLAKIKKEYFSVFGATWSCNSIFERRFNVSINEDEIAYISLHIAAAIDRLKNKIRTIVVCSSGIGTSQIVSNRLRKRLNELEIVDVIPLNYLTEKVIEENDLIISTIAIPNENNKIIHISTFVDEIDIIKIRKFLSETKFNDFKIKDNILQNNNYIENLITPDYCFIDDGNNSYLEIIKKYALIMEKNKLVKKGFSDNILEREQKDSTIIGHGITIPHSSEDFVLIPKICIIKLNNPITWNDEDVDLILILALKFKDVNTTKLFFQNFYSLLDNEHIIENIRQSKDVEKILSLFLDSTL